MWFPFCLNKVIYTVCVIMRLHECASVWIYGGYWWRPAVCLWLQRRPCHPCIPYYWWYHSAPYDSRCRWMRILPPVLLKDLWRIRRVQLKIWLTFFVWHTPEDRHKHTWCTCWQVTWGPLCFLQPLWLTWTLCIFSLNADKTAHTQHMLKDTEVER